MALHDVAGSDIDLGPLRGRCTVALHLRPGPDTVPRRVHYRAID